MDNEVKVIHDEDGIIIDRFLNGTELTVGRDSIGEWVMLDSVLFYMDEWIETLNNINEMIVQLRREEK